MDSSPRHLVLGTAGHIDHGKSALVERLTGVHPDRLAEERRRGITIELGFADVELSPGRVVSLVDVPGHERFVRHMVAGATGIQAVLLVVAADQGVQPQTVEHLAICSLLGLRHGVVALTKCDLVDAELAEVAALEVRELLGGGPLADAAVLHVSSRTGEGIDELRSALGALFDVAAPPPTDGLARLSVDRSFVLRGFGTVVTGTLVGGPLREGDEVEVLPGGARGRIRGLQTHHAACVEALPGRRVAVNLQGLETDDAPRGAVLVRPGTMETTRRLRARLTLLPGTPPALARGGPARFHHGTAERAARYRVLRAEPDGTLHAEIFLAGGAAVVPGDRFVLRRPAPLDTVGGGVAIEIRPPARAAAEPAAFALTALDPQTALATRLRRARAAGRERTDLARELGLTSARLDAAAEALAARDELVALRGIWFDGRSWRELGQAVVERLEAFHRAEPLRLGISREELRAAVEPTMAQEAWRRLLDELAAAGRVAADGDRVAAAGHAVVLDDATRELAERLEARFLAGGLEPPEPARALADLPADRAGRVIELLIARGRLVRLHDGKLFHAEVLAGLRERLRLRARSEPTIDVAAFKELAGVTRKHAIPLLEHLDAERSTRRRGNTREILLK